MSTNLASNIKLFKSEKDIQVATEKEELRRRENVGARNSQGYRVGFIGAEYQGRAPRGSYMARLTGPMIVEALTDAGVIAQGERDGEHVVVFLDKDGNVPERIILPSRDEVEKICMEYHGQLGGSLDSTEQEEAPKQQKKPATRKAT